MTKKKDLTKRPVGRPSLYKPEYCEKVIELGRKGCSPAEIASDLDVDRATLIRWSGEHEEFRTALTRAKIHEQAWWEKAGKAGMVADRFNAQVWTKSVAARFREDYTERQELTGAAGGPVAVASVDLRGLSDAELATMKALLGKATDPA
jgi:transposase-like protein